jgi:hypothetical protein
MDVSQVLNPLDSLVDAGAKLLGIPPQIAAFIKEGVDLAKIAAGAASGNVALAMDGAQGLITNLSSQLSKPKTEYRTGDASSTGGTTKGSGSHGTTVKTPPRTGTGNSNSGSTGYSTTASATEQTYMAFFIAELVASTTQTTKSQLPLPAAQKTSTGSSKVASSTGSSRSSSASLTVSSSTNSSSPADPLLDARLSALQTLSKNFSIVDGAGAFAGITDGLMGMSDLQAIVNKSDGPYRPAHRVAVLH